MGLRDLYELEGHPYGNFNSGFRIKLVLIIFCLNYMVKITHLSMCYRLQMGAGAQCRQPPAGIRQTLQALPAGL